MTTSLASRPQRVAKAIHLRYTTDMTLQEIADELGVHENTVHSYVNDGPTAEEVNEVMQQSVRETRVVAINELKRQLQEACVRSKTAEKPVKVWQDEHGNVNVNNIRNQQGQVVDREPVPMDVEILPDQEARYVSRKEVRDILDKMVKLTGAAEPQRHEVNLVDDWKESAND